MASLVNGQPADSIPLDDRGLLFGDHLFETMAVWRGRVPLWSWHWERLLQGAGTLGLELPPRNEIECDIRALAEGRERCVLRLTVTRGSGGRAYFPDPQMPVRRIVQRRSWPQHLESEQRHGLVMGTAELRLATGSTMVGLKHGNRLEQVLAARECQARGLDELVLLDAHGRLAEAIASNLILIRDGVCLTPASTAGVAGVGLAWLMAQPELEIERVALDAKALAAAESLMVINSVAGVRPALSLDGRPLAAGSQCRDIQRLWRQRLFSSDPD